MNCQKNRMNRRALLLILIIILLEFTQISAVSAQKPEYSLSIQILQAPPINSKLCVGEYLDIIIRVSAISSADPNFDRPLSNINVKVSHDTIDLGTRTSQDGVARISQQLNHQDEGTLTVTVSADPFIGLKASPVILNYRVAQCGKWNLEIKFTEIYRVIEGSDWFIGASVTWSDIITIQDELNQSPAHSGHWSVENYESVNTPLGVQFNKDLQTLQGEFDILWRTEKNGDNLIWFFETQPVSFPPSGLNWDFSLATPNLNTFERSFIPERVPVWYGNGRFLELNGLDRHLFKTNVTKPMSKTVQWNKVPVFFNSPPPVVYQIYIRWSPLPPQ